MVNPTHPNAINIHKPSLILPSMGGNYICNYHPQMDGLLLGLHGFTTLLALTVPNSGHHLRAKSRSGVAASSLRAPCSLGRGDKKKKKNISLSPSPSPGVQLTRDIARIRNTAAREEPLSRCDSSMVTSEYIYICIYILGEHK